MRIVIDMQGAQTDSRTRGIGRYSLSLALAMVRNRGDHEILLALNGLFPESVESIRTAFRNLLPPENIRIWHAPGPILARDPTNATRRSRAEAMREAFLASLQPDIVHLTSLFEGFVDDAATSIGQLLSPWPTSVTLYDLIPLHDPERFLRSEPGLENWYQGKLASLTRADLLLAISEATATDARDRLGRPAGSIVNVSTACSDMFRQIDIPQVERQALFSRLRIDRPFVLTSGTVEPHKNLARLFAAFAMLPAKLRAGHRIVLCARESQRPILRKIARDSGLSANDLVITGYLSDRDLVVLNNLCAVMAFPSFDEGFGLPALEAMACGAAVIGSDAASIPEVIGRKDALFEPFDVRSMAAKMEAVLTDAALVASLKAHGLQQATSFSWDKTAVRCLDAMAELATRRGLAGVLDAERPGPLDQCIAAIARQPPPPSDAESVALASCLARSILPPGHRRQLLVDVSELSQRDARTGCQRVTRSVILEFLKNPPDGLRVEPVFATADRLGYRYARSFTRRLTGRSIEGGDDPVDYAPGDIFFGLDYQAPIVTVQEKSLLAMKRQGVSVSFLVYDILSITHSQYFWPGSENGFAEWLRVISQFDGVIGISKATADALADWYSRNGITLDPDFRFAWAHLGADIENSAPTFGLPHDSAEILRKLGERPSFLMVGTLEPRKGHAQTLAAFDALWSSETDANLVIVGRLGWHTEALAERLRGHPQLGKRLFWLEGISDEYLEKIYAASTCLIAASEGEGFGLPLIEAARHNLPILARDIAVFREVAGQHAEYFSGHEPSDLAYALRNWLARYRDGHHAKSDGMPWLTWAQSAERLKEILFQSHRQQAPTPVGDQSAT